MDNGMKAYNLRQGSDEWHALRASVDGTASEAPVMMGASKKMRRDELLAMKKLGIEREISEYVQRFIFSAGHESEASARPLVEAIIGQDLYPVTGTREIEGLTLLASLDGTTDFEDTLFDEEIWIPSPGDLLFEHKLWNQSLVAMVNAGEVDDPEKYWQLEQQALVTGVYRIKFVVSDGTETNMVHCWYKSQPERRKQLIRGWHQFVSDLKDYEHIEKVIKPEAKVVRNLPTPSIRINGEIALISNLDVFGKELDLFVSGINMKPEDDQAFADAESAVKILQKAQDALDTAEAAALSQAASIDEMRTAKQLHWDLARNTRLTLQKVIASQKETIRLDILNTAREKLSDYLRKINEGLGGEYVVNHGDFVTAMKGKRTIETLRNAANTELAQIKMEASELAEKIRKNISSLKELIIDHKFLFQDFKSIVYKDNDDLVILAKHRIQEYENEQAELQRKKDQEAKLKAEQEEERRREEERERIRREDAAKLQAEAEADNEKRLQDERDKEIVPDKAQEQQGHVSNVIDAPAATGAPTPVHYRAPDSDLMARKESAILLEKRQEIISAIKEIGSPMSTQKAKILLKAIEDGLIPRVQVNYETINGAVA